MNRGRAMNVSVVSRRPPKRSNGSRSSRISLLGKRGFDLVAASLLTILGLPLIALVATMVALDGGPVLYRSERVGKNNVIFYCFKFRTMMPEADRCIDEYLYYHPAARTQWLHDRKLSFDPRVSFLGGILRRSSLDELPQLINVIRGEMSLVGPRPVTRSELDDYYRSSADLYSRVRPGMTGLWQVSGRNDVGYARRVALDERYVREWSFILDIRILCATPLAVFSKRGAR